MDTANFVEPPLVETVTSKRQLERDRARKMAIAGYVGGGLLLFAFGLIMVAMVVEPKPETGNPVLAAETATSETMAPPTPMAAPAVDNAAVDNVAVAAVSTAVEPSVSVVKSVEMPAALSRLVNERMAAPDQERFLADWAAMSRADRIAYLKELGYDVTGL